MIKFIKTFLLSVFIIIIPILFFDVFGHKYETDKISVDDFYQHYDAFASDAYGDRTVGSESHKATQDYIINYLTSRGYKIQTQEFTTLVASKAANELFYLNNADYKDHFTLITNGYSKSIDFEGALVFLNASSAFDPAFVKNRLVVTTNKGELLDLFIEKLVDAGCKGILLSPDAYYDVDPKDLTYKKAKAIPILHIDESLHGRLLDLAELSQIERVPVNFSDAYASSVIKSVGVVKDVRIKSTYTIKMLRGKNIFANLDTGSHMETLMFASNYDGDSVAFDFSSCALNLSLANRLKNDAAHLKKQVVFAFFDATALGGKGSDYYINHPIYDLSKTSIIGFDNVGKKKSQITSYSKKSEFLKYELLQYERRTKTSFNQVNYNPYGNKTNSDLKNFNFIDAKIIYIGHNLVGMDNRVYENFRVEKSNIEPILSIMDYYLKETVYKDYFPDYFQYYDWLFVLSMVICILIISLVRQLKNEPLYSYKVNKFYYSMFYTVFMKVFNMVFIFTLTLIIILAIAEIPTSFDLYFGDKVIYNHSVYTIMYGVVDTIRDLIKNGLGQSSMGSSYLSIILKYSLISFRLLTTAIISSVILGVVIGVVSSYYRKKQHKNQSLSVIIGLSIPEALVTFLLILFMPQLARVPVLKNVDVSVLRTVYMPLFTMTFIPTIYVSRIVYLTITEELKKKYIISLKAKGVSKFRLYTKHLLRLCFTKVLDIMPILLTIGIANMILCEYIFSVPGLVLNIFDALRLQAFKYFLGLTISIMIYYYMVIYISKIILKLLIPQYGGTYEVE